ncbi:MAG: hypothetical protein ACK5KR_02160 [Breznakia sp.]
MKKKLLLSGIVVGVMVTSFLIGGQMVSARAKEKNTAVIGVHKTIEQVNDKAKKQVEPVAPEVKAETKVENVVTQTKAAQPIVQQTPKQPTKNYVDCNGSGNCNGVNCQSAECPYLTPANNYHNTNHNNKQNANQGNHHDRNEQYHRGERNQYHNR